MESRTVKRPSEIKKIMKKAGQTIKSSHNPDHGADFNANVAQYGSLSPSMMDTLTGLEYIFTSKTPEKEIREAMTDRPHKLMLPHKKMNVKKYVNQGVEVRRRSAIREALIELLEAVDRRDSKFFGDMARFFSGPEADYIPIAADGLRLELSARRWTGDSPTLQQITDKFRVDRRTASRAAKDVGLKLKTGRPHKKVDN